MNTRTNTIKTLTKKETELLIKYKLNKECQRKNLKTFCQAKKNNEDQDVIWNKFERNSNKYMRIEIDIEDELENIKKEKRAVRKKYKDEIKEHWEKYKGGTGNTADLYNLLNETSRKLWVLRVKNLTTMKNKEFLPQIKETINFYKAPPDYTWYVKEKIPEKIQKILKDEKRLELLEEYYGSNAAHVPNIIRLLKYADSKFQNYFERIETDKRIAERARISDEKTNKWSSECCWAKDEET